MKTTIGIAVGLLVLGAARIDAQPPAADVQKVQTLIASTQYPSRRLTSPTVAVWAIARQGAHIGNFEIRVTTEKGIVVTFVTVAQKVKIRRTPELMEKFLTAANDYDYVKIGFDADGDAYVRIDSNLRTLDGPELDSVITQVGNVTDNVWQLLSPFLMQ